MIYYGRRVLEVIKSMAESLEKVKFVNYSNILNLLKREEKNNIYANWSGMLQKYLLE